MRKMMIPAMVAAMIITCAALVSARQGPPVERSDEIAVQLKTASTGRSSASPKRMNDKMLLARSAQSIQRNPRSSQSKR